MSTTNKTLYVSFAMGGGVSLGSFSGGALTEALRALVMIGQDAEGNPYDRVVLDSMSGASAGAISLAAMLRELLKEEGDTGQTGDHISEQKWAQVRAIERAQKQQASLWVDLLKMKDFCVEKTEKQQSFGLLSQEIMKQIIHDQILSEVDQINYHKGSILGDRVLFACSLTNLQPVSLTPQDSEDFPLVKEAYKSTTSYEHKELRVFDLRLGNQPESVIPNWITYDLEALKKAESWAEISATAVACGAFPVAFEPVVLERSHEEFSFILSLDHANKKHPYCYLEDFSTFKFPYVDGGTFNNEPIREAFRLAFHLDAERRRKQPEQAFDRLIIFVDPIVSPEAPAFNISAFDPYKMQKEKVRKKNPMSKLFPLASTMIGMLRDEGSVKEENKIRNFTQTVQLRRSLFEYLEDIISILPSSKLEAKLWDSLKESVQRRLKRDFIPLGVSSAEEYLLIKLEENYAMLSEEMPMGRGIEEKSERFAFFEDIIEGLLKDKEGFHQLKALLAMIKRETAQEKSARSVDEQDLVNMKTNLRKAFLSLLVDFALDLDGKDEKAMRVSITPIAYGKTAEEVKTISLPGSEMEAFTGFGVHHFQFASFNYGRYCALKALSRNDFRAYHFQTISQNPLGGKQAFLDPDKSAEMIQNIQFTPDKENTQDEYLQEIKENLFKPLTKRVGAIVSFWIRNPLLKAGIGLGIWIPRYIVGNNRLVFNRVGRDIFEKETLPGLTLMLKGSQFQSLKKYRFGNDLPWIKGLWDEEAEAFVIKGFLHKKGNTFLLSHIAEQAHSFQLVPTYQGDEPGPCHISTTLEVTQAAWKGQKAITAIPLSEQTVTVKGKFDHDPTEEMAILLNHIDLFNHPVLIYDGRHWYFEDRVKSFREILMEGVKEAG